MPKKGNKSIAKDILENRYPLIQSSSLPTSWKVESVIFDAMFMIHKTRKNGKTMSQYALMLYSANNSDSIYTTTFNVEPFIYT